MVRLAAALLLIVWLLTACTVPARPMPSPELPRRPQALAARSRAPGLPLDLDAHYRYILAAQRSTGAIAMTPEGTAINPYFANLAGLALLTQPQHMGAVERYLNWYLAHLNPDGTIDDYRLQGGREVATGDADSTDSYAATFLSLVAAWVQAGGDPTWVKRNRASLDRVAGAIVAVTDRDGLTWAKPGFSHKLLMDNCEVYRGWADWSRLLQAQGDPLGALSARTRADGLKAGLSQFRQQDGAWGWAIDRSGQLIMSGGSSFYPDAVAQVFPLIFGVSDDRAGYRQMDAWQPAWRDLRAGDFPWLLPAYAAARAGDAPAVRQALEGVAAKHSQLRWPWFVAESAWVVRAATLVIQ